MQNSIKDLEQQVKHLAGKSGVQAQELAAAKQQGDAQSSALQQLKQQKSFLEGQLRQRESQLQQQQAELQERQALLQELDIAKQSLTNAQRQIADAELSWQGSQHSQDTLQKELVLLQQQAKENSRLQQDFQRQLSDKDIQQQSTVSNLKVQLGAEQRSMAATQGELVAAKQETLAAQQGCQKLKAELSEAQQQFDALKVELAAARRAAMKAKEEENRRHTSWSAAERKLEAEKDALQVLNLVFGFA